MSEYIKKIRTTTGDKQIDYEGLGNIPQVNGVSLVGNKSLDDLSIQPKGDYTTKSEFNANVQRVDEELFGVKDRLSSEIERSTQQDATLSARMDEFTKLPDGSTAGNAELVDIRVGHDGTTYETAGQAVRGQIEQVYGEFDKASVNYYGKEYETLKQRLDSDYDSLLDRMNEENFEGEYINADGTYARNLSANGSSFEILGNTIQNCLDANSQDKFYNMNGIIDEEGYISFIGDGNWKEFDVRLENGIIKPSTNYTLIIEVLENTLLPSSATALINSSTTSTISMFDSKSMLVNQLNVGINKILLQSKSDLTNCTVVNRTVFSNTITSGSFKFRMAIYEGDWTNKDIGFLPFGLNYPQNTIVKMCGKNWFDEKIGVKYGYYADTTGGYISNNTSFCCSELIPINQNTMYITSSNLTRKSVWLYDINKNPIKKASSTAFNTENYSYVAISLSLPSQDINDFEWLQLEASDSATEYEPFVGNEVQINKPLPAISETVRDRIFSKGGKIYYEQNVKEIILDGSDDEGWGVNTHASTDTIRFSVYLSDLFNGRDVLISDKFATNNGYSSNQEGIYSNTEKNMSVYINKTKLETQDVAGFKKWLQANNIKVLYQLATPIITELTDLSSFYSYDGMTNIYTTNEVKPYLKFSLPVSYKPNTRLEVEDARVGYFGHKYDTLEDRLDGDFNELLNKTKETVYEGTSINATDTIARNLSSNGNTVEILGQTVQNCLDISSADKFLTLGSGVTIDKEGYINVTADGSYKAFISKIESAVLKPSTLYTIVVDVKENTLTGSGEQLQLLSIGSTITCFETYVNKTLPVGITKVTATTKSSFDDITSSVAGTVIQNMTSGSIKFRYMILEGDWTKRDVSFVPFGLNYPDSTTINMTGLNVFDHSSADKFVYLIGNVDNDGYINMIANGGYVGARTKKETATLKPSTLYTFVVDVKENSLVGEGEFFTFADYSAVIPCSFNVKIVSNLPVGITKFTMRTIEDLDRALSVDSFYIRPDAKSGSIKFRYAILEGDWTDKDIPEISYKFNTNTINQPLPSINDSIRDRVYMQNGKLYYEQNVKEIIFDGSEDEKWENPNVLTNTSQFGIKIDDVANSSACVCDRFYYLPNTTDVQHIIIGSTQTLYIHINNSSLNSTTKEEFKKWLQANNVKVLYQLATPIITELGSNYDFYSYDSQTNIFTTNTVKPTLRFGLPREEILPALEQELVEARTSYMGETYETLDDRINADINFALGKVDVMNYKDTTIHANNTYARNLTVNGNKIEILGQTIQNCLDHSNQTSVANSTSGVTIEEGYININATGVSQAVYFKKNKAIIKPNTQYTFVIETLENTIQPETANCGFDNYTGITTSFIGGGAIQVSQFNGVLKKLFTSKEDLTTPAYSSSFMLLKDATSGTLKFRYAIIEGDWTNKEVSFVPFGLNYPTTTEVKMCGKNLFDYTKIPSKNISGLEITNNQDGSFSFDGTIYDSGRYQYNYFTHEETVGMLKAGKITLVSEVGQPYAVVKLIYNGGSILLQTLSRNTVTSTIEQYMLDDPTSTLMIGFYIGENQKITNAKSTPLLTQDDNLDYTPFTGNTELINKPLASVSDIIRDRVYVKDGKVYHEQNVIEMEINENSTFSNFTELTKTVRFTTPLIEKGKSDNVCLSSKLISQLSYELDKEHIYVSSIYAFLFIDKEKLETYNQDGARKYFETNKDKIIYQISTPIITELGDVEDFYSYDEQTNWYTTNTVKPTLDVDIPSNLTALVSTLMTENTALKQSNAELTSTVESQSAELEEQKVINEEQKANNTFLAECLMEMSMKVYE